MGYGGHTTNQPQRRGPRRMFAPWADPAARPLVRFDGVSKRFGTATAVERVSLDIFSGEFFALLGPSGCGKTTLLRLLAGLEMPDDGRILLDGAELTTVPPYRRPINLMFQSYALFPHLTVEGNIAFGLKQEGLPKAEIASRVDEMLALVRLEVMDHGRLVQVATPQEIYERPTSRWVADFIGEINLIEGSVIEVGRSGTVVASAAGRLRALSPADVTAGDVVWVALRPEKVR